MSPRQVDAKIEAEVERDSSPDQPPMSLISSTKHYRDVELNLQLRLSNCFSDSHNLRTNQRLGNAEFDVILESKLPHRADVIVEVKYLRKGFRFGWMRESASRLLLATDLYEDRIQRKTSPLLLLVTGPELQLGHDTLDDLKERLPQQLSRCRIAVLKEEEISSSTCDRLRQSVLT
jgi:hypothetical protein